jgi:Domain of unknown function (DUF4267)
MAPDSRLRARSAMFWLVALIAAGIIFIGARFLVVPLPAADAFGVPANGSHPLAYLWAKGTRDIVSGLLLMALVLAGASRRIVALFLAVAALIPIGDFLNVRANEGVTNPTALAIHGGTAVGMLILAWCLARSRTEA